jgi:hypothetical protein
MATATVQALRDELQASDRNRGAAADMVRDLTAKNANLTLSNQALEAQVQCRCVRRVCVHRCCAALVVLGRTQHPRPVCALRRSCPS